MQKKYLIWNVAMGTLFGWIVDENKEIVTAGSIPGVTDRQEVEAFAADEGAELEIWEGKA